MHFRPFPAADGGSGSLEQTPAHDDDLAPFQQRILVFSGVDALDAELLLGRVVGRLVEGLLLGRVLGRLVDGLLLGRGVGREPVMGTRERFELEGLAREEERELEARERLALEERDLLLKERDDPPRLPPPPRELRA